MRRGHPALAAMGPWIQEAYRSLLASTRIPADPKECLAPENVGSDRVFLDLFAAPR